MKKTAFIVFGIILTLSLSAQNLNLFKKEVFKDRQGRELPYRILYPKSYDKNSSYPLLLFLHGSGERGNDNEAQLRHISPLLLEEYNKDENKAIVILPQCPEDDMWISSELRDNIKAFSNLYIEQDYPISNALQSVSELLDHMLSLPQVDKNQVSIMGLSLGGYGTLELLSRRPNTFVKAAPICGGGVIAFAKRYSPYTAIKLFHGAEDKVVIPDHSRALFDRLKSLNADVSYKEYPGVEHNSWDYAFAEPGLMKWLTTPAEKVMYLEEKDIAYSEINDRYASERCKLDIYYPSNRKDFSTIVWFHGGGLEGGEKYIPEELKNKGIAIISVNYRLNPKVTAPSYIDDAAAAVAWAFKNIEKYGGNNEKIYISGHSAGGYLTLMLGMDKSYLDKFHVNVNDIKGFIPISGQTITHNIIRREMNLPEDTPLIEGYAPLNHIGKTPPMLLITGDREMELTSRLEENQYLTSALKAKGNDITLYEMQGFDHGTVVSPACFLMLEWIEKQNKK